MTLTPVIAVENASKYYGKLPGICSANLKLYPGEAAVLAGPNGAGKTTLLHMCAGLLAPSSGYLSVNGYSWGAAEGRSDRVVSLPSDLWRMRLRLGFVPASHEVVERITAREFLRFTAAIHNLPDVQAKHRIDRWLKFLDLAGSADRPLGSFSHGMRKKIQIAAALLPEPSLFICDEPTSGLDPEMMAMIRELISVLRDQGVAVLLATHDLAFAERVGQRFYFVHRSRIVADGSAADLSKQFGAPNLEAAFLKAIGAAAWRDELHALVADYKTTDSGVS